MREIIIDTETTGLSPDKGHRLVEIGAIELIHRVPTGRRYHTYINPRRAMPQEAFLIHGLSEEFLKDFPYFEQVKDDFLSFVGHEDQLVIHNADFDLGFINAELKWANHPSLIDKGRIIDTLRLARKRFPGLSNNLDALCKRFNISLAQRQKHGALIDAQLLAEIYIELLGGRQQNLILESPGEEISVAIEAAVGSSSFPQRPCTPLTSAEEKAHSQLLESLSGPIMWHQAS